MAARLLAEPIRKVGVINCYKTPSNISILTRAIRLLGASPIVFQVADPTWVSVAQSSAIRHWIVSGSEWNVKDNGAPRIPPDLMLDREKRWIFVCYGMQSVLCSLGAEIYKLPEYKRAAETVEGRLYWRNHGWGFDRSGVRNLRIAAPVFASDGILMRCYIGNAVLMQYHPERTLEGLEELRDFVRS